MKTDIVFVIDRSSSMKPVMDVLNSNINSMIACLKEHYLVQRFNKFLSIFCFPPEGTTGMVVKGEPVDSLDKDFSVNLKAMGATDPSKALNEALDFCVPRYKEWVNNKEECNRPLLFYITDGRPNAGAISADMRVDPEKQRIVEEAYEKVAAKIKECEKEGNLYFVGCGIGDKNNGADIDKIKELTDFSSHVIDMTKYDAVEAIKVFFGEFFVNVTSSVSDNALFQDMLLSIPDMLDNLFNE